MGMSRLRLLSEQTSGCRSRPATQRVSHRFPRKSTSLRQRLRELQARVAELERERQRLHALAHLDGLTGLANRRKFEIELERAVRCARRYHGTLSLLMIDLDGMKRLNDEHGHPAGDAALRAFGDALRRSLRACDVAARLGGDEFAVILPATDAAGGALVAERLREAAALLGRPAGAALSASIGVATLGSQLDVSTAMSDLVTRADVALYAAKRAGRNRVERDAA